MIDAEVEAEATKIIQKAGNIAENDEDAFWDWDNDPADQPKKQDTPRFEEDKNNQSEFNQYSSTQQD